MKPIMLSNSERADLRKARRSPITDVDIDTPAPKFDGLERDRPDVALAAWSRFRAAGIVDDVDGLNIAKHVQRTIGDDQPTSLMYAYSTFSWGASGCPRFRLSHGLASALVLTDCRGVRGADLKWPFRSWAIEPPRDGGPFDGADLEWDYVDIERPREAQRIIITKGLWPDADGIRSVFVSIEGDCGERSFLGHWPEDDEPVERWMVLSGGDFGDYEKDLWSKVVRLIVNTSLYINEQRRAGKWDPKSRRRPGAKAVWDIGGEIKLPRELRDAARVFRSGVPSSWRVRSRFIVRGHWRNQACGKGQTERRRRWIQPFWKGPKDGPKLQRLYLVDEQMEKK